MLQGYSNFDTILKGSVVIKSAKNEKDYNRLVKEIRKQIMFDTELYEGIQTPKIIEGKMDDKSYTMDYIPDSNLIIMLKNGIDENFVNKLKRYFEINIKNSIKKDIMPSFKEKYENTYRNCMTNKYLKTNKDFHHVDFLFKDLLSNLSEMFVPVSYCHGDLTISNMLYKNDTLYFIDFLDNFSNTVIQDMVKIRQDTQFKLIMKMNGLYDLNVKNNLNNLDEIFNDLFSKYPFYNNYYILFQYLSLLRILPYCNKKHIISHIIKSMNDLFI